MSNSYTPGPWNLHTPDEGDPTTGDGTFCITARSMVIANVQPSDWHETPANALLIAAAPDLLVACKSMLVAFSAPPGSRILTDHSVGASVVRGKAKASARAAIARAEGGAK